MLSSLPVWYHSERIAAGGFFEIARAPSNARRCRPQYIHTCRKYGTPTIHCTHISGYAPYILLDVCEKIYLGSYPSG